MRDVIIVGGGLAGLINAVLLSRAGLSVLLIEKKNYPFHRVCGEYISNEVVPFLRANDLYPEGLAPSQISRFELSSVKGRVARQPLGMGGFGISRYMIDEFLAGRARSAGVEVMEGTTVRDVRYVEEYFEVETSDGDFESRLVIGAFGKRSKLDTHLKREFMHRRSPYLAVKYHVRTDYSKDSIALHNFRQGYCGVSSVGGDTYNLCYLSHRDNLKGVDIPTMEERVLHQNPLLASLWRNADFLLERPLVINEISFEKKEAIWGHVLMCGDTAGMITPLCGNGMAMAIRSAWLLSGLILRHWNNGSIDRGTLELAYQKVWNEQFAYRLWAGGQFQRMFGSPLLSELGVALMRQGLIARKLIGLSHGEVFEQKSQ
ncbi:FAD-dependent oxidoreductase [Reichenbachiella sp. 5M10]|uniref:NAD(P)/FAD-dependent oxidoreductase n=1 Tax=Reichenbachiella sp. 5M10 TaxID=1889772 RepID=UPI000C15BEDD|nr:NAD(P)/FAD-dependent oxidoreductase [Reichenbachiella sp. 5M10]PIB36883.1 FAD-dependent oxidoreductase [Reichenbachiella sp. 5M10]